ncbi:hypothetical protein SBRCBS47491_008878 [Sporothrix bragantina]|uniref:F-box domain-containing protein n=1 Tax=Sporothrix bragantina TaxID=671064 RepID=A0ABP0CTE1_9PEZI
MDNPAAARFTQNPELIALLAKQIKEPYHLRTLRRVNSAFRDLVTPILFSHVYINSTRAHRINELLQRVPLEHVSTLTVDHCHNHLNVLNNKLQEEVLPRLPHLTSFRWLIGGLEKQTLHSLSGLCPKLTSLRVVADTDEWYQKQGDWFYSEEDLLVQMPPFTGLEDLAFHGLKNNRLQLRELAALLRNNSTTLRSLHLSTLDATYKDCPECPSGRRTGHVKFGLYLDDLGTFYCHPPGLDGPYPLVPRLALRKLTIGPSVALPSDWLAEKFLDRSVLEELRQTNCRLELSKKYPFWFDTRIFDETRCPNLRIFSVGVMDTDMVEFFASRKPEWTRQLAVVAALQRNETPLVEHLWNKTLPWRMIVVDLTEAPTHDDAGDEDGDAAKYAICVLAALSEVDQGCLQGIQLVLRKTQWQLLYLESVLEAFDAFLNFRQLSITFTWMPADGVYQQMDSRDLTLFLAKHIRSLRYIKISSCAWRV